MLLAIRSSADKISGFRRILPDIPTVRGSEVWVFRCEDFVLGSITFVLFANEVVMAPECVEIDIFEKGFGNALV